MADLPLSTGFSVLLCTDYLPPGSGGVEVVVEHLACDLSDAGVDVCILTLEDNADSRPTLEDYGVAVETVPTYSLTDTIGLQSQVAPASIPRFKRILNEFDPDVIHLHQRFFFLTATGALWSWLRQVEAPLVTTLHLGPVDGIDGLEGLAARLFEQTIGRSIIHTSDHIITVSQAVADHSATLGGNPMTTTVIPNAVNPATFYPEDERDQDGTRILYVGRLIQNKGLETLLKALPLVLSKHPDTIVDIVGTGPLDDKLRAKADEMGISDAVRFLGYVDDVAATMRRADIFCRPSTSEGMPLTLLEAMASGLPAVVTPVAGVPEVVDDGETGVLVPPEQPEVLAHTLNLLIESPPQRRQIGSRAREYVTENHTWPVRTERVMEVYRKLQTGYE